MVIFSNLGPGDSYSVSTYRPICTNCFDGPDINIQSNGLGTDFTPAGTDFILDTIEVPLTLFFGPNLFVVQPYIDQDGDGAHLAALEKVTSGGMQMSPQTSLLKVSSSKHPILTAGTRYWVLTSVPDFQTGIGSLPGKISDAGLLGVFYGSCSGSGATCFSNRECPAGQTCQPQSVTLSIIATSTSPGLRVSGAPCGILAQPTVTLGKLATPPGDDTLTMQGSVTLPVPADPPLDPLTNGIQVLLGSAKGMVVNRLEAYLRTNSVAVSSVLGGLIAHGA